MRDRNPTIRSHLFALVLGVLLPVIAFIVYLSVLLVRHEQSAIERGAVDRTRAYMSAVDAELRGSITTLQALAALHSLETGDLRDFREQAVRVLGSQPTWIDVTLATPDGRLLASATQSLGSEPPAMADPASVREVASTLQPSVGSLSLQPLLGQYGVPVRVPVVLNGTLRYVLTGFVKPESFGDLIREQQLPPDWISGLVDAGGRFIARIPPQPVAELSSEGFRAAVRKSQQGWYRGRSVEGRDIFTAHFTSQFSGWSIGLGIPVPVVYAAAQSAGWLVLGGALASIALALGSAYWIGSRIARQVEQTVSERQALLEREKEALRSADRAKDEFLAVLGHELRNPLAALATSAHVLKVAPPRDVAAIKARGVVERQTKQMTRLVEDLLDISRITMGKATLDREVLDLAELARGVVRTFRQTGRPGAAAIRLEAAQAWIDADRARLEQVLTNLLDNALKFSSPQAPVTVSVRQDGGQAVLTVADVGIGIESGAIRHIFDLFVQGEQGPDRSKGGLGIGLALVKRVVELHGGEVAAASEGIGRGAVFSVRLPAAARPAEARAPVAAPRAAGARSILIIEDNDDARQMLGAVLSLSGHTVREAHDGASGLERAAAEAPEVALIDIGLPDLDGYEVARRLRSGRGGRDMKLIAITGYGQPEDERRALEAGFDAHLTKPVAADVLKDVLASLS